MKITAVRTVRLERHSNVCLVQIETDEGLTGLGETFFGAAGVESHLHDVVAPALLGQDPLRIERLAREIRGYLGFRDAGTETRAASAVDIALWDLLGQASGQPLYALLGGRTRDSVQTYNTCAGYDYIASGNQASRNWNLPAGTVDRPYEDLNAFLTDAGALARSLLDQGIRGMKIWPFDRYAEPSDGHYISAGDLDRALAPFRQIREAVGDAIDVMLELHGLWDLPNARRIARAVEQFDPFWIEDPIDAGDTDSLLRLAESTSIPLAVSETLAGRTAFVRLLGSGAAGYVIADLSWCGGITEAAKIGALADAHSLPLAPHDCTGPVVWTASTHLSVSAPNGFLQESVRAYYTDWYADLVTALPVLVDGRLAPPEGPGLGTALRPDVLARSDALVRTTSAS